MDISAFVRSLYVGDRACKAIVFDGWEGAMRVHVNCISRVRSLSGDWEYYTDEDIADGVMVFEGVDWVELENSGRMPNDLINSIEVIATLNESSTVELSIDAVGPDGIHHETFLRIRCRSLHLEDPHRPGHKISS
jgi:hypothetical protein